MDLKSNDWFLQRKRRGRFDRHTEGTGHVKMEAGVRVMHASARQETSRIAGDH